MVLLRGLPLQEGSEVRRFARADQNFPARKSVFDLAADL
jgi:hypothetical protein